MDRKERNHIANLVKALAVVYIKQHKLSSGPAGIRETNNGFCEDFALDLVRRVGGEVHWLGDSWYDRYPGEWPRGVLIPAEDADGVGHAAALIDGFWFDSETPEGVREWIDLNSVRRWYGGG